MNNGDITNSVITNFLLPQLKSIDLLPRVAVIYILSHLPKNEGNLLLKKQVIKDLISIEQNEHQDTWIVLCLLMPFSN